jgi:hypothetical protein
MAGLFGLSEMNCFGGGRVGVHCQLLIIRKSVRVGETVIGPFVGTRFLFAANLHFKLLRG